MAPETLLAWHRKLISQKYNGTGKRPPGRPCTADKVERLVVAWPRIIMPGAIVDPLFTAESLKMLTDTGVESVKLPPRSPNLNAHAERLTHRLLVQDRTGNYTAEQMLAVSSWREQ